ncbi:MAG: hypothetical protein WBB19_17210 [Desulforhopalus sp.]
MAIAIYPPELPSEALRDGYVENHPNNLLAFPGDSGFGKVRPKGATPPFTYTYSMLLTTAQRLILKNFVYITLRDGALRFEHSHPVDDISFEARFFSDSQELYKVTSSGLDFIVTLNVMILP